MVPLTFTDTHNIVAYLSKSDASDGFDQIMDFFNAHTIQYALVLRALIDGKKVVVSKDIIQRDIHLDNADGVKCLPNEEIFKALALPRGLYGMSSVVPWHLPSYSSIRSYPYTPCHTSTRSPSTPHASPPQEQPTTTSDSSMSLLTTLMETCATLSQKVAELEQDKHAQALEILQLKKRVKKLEKKKRSKSSGFKWLRKIKAIDADKDITLVDVEKDEEVVAIDAELQRRINQKEVNAACKGVSAVEPTIFDDKEVTMTMAQTLIKLKAEKAKLLDEQIAQKPHDEEYDDNEEKIDWSVVTEQVQERHMDNIRKYQSLKKKPVSIAQARKNMIIYLKNMARYEIEHFKGMNYDKVRLVFEREYKKVQTLFKPDKDVEEPKKKRVAEETLLQESFKKQRATEVSGSRTYWKIIRVGGIIETYQSFEDMLKGFNKEDLVALWSLVKEKFSSAVPNVDKEKALWVKRKRLFKPDADDIPWKLQRYMHAPLTWKLYIDCGVHHVSSTRRHDMFMLTEKDYPLSNGVIILMLSGKLQVEKENEMARDLVMNIFIEAKKPKSRSLDTSSK
nr:hypothetical protein [Tanacetum cinerariifolium]